MATPEQIGAVCGTCGFRYFEHNGHIIACPVCALAAKDQELLERDDEIAALVIKYEAKDAEIERLKEDVEVGLNLTGSFFEALKPLKLKAINVSNPGQHVTDLIEQITQLRSQLAVAQGMRNKAEFWIQHRTSDYGRCTCSHEQHHWTDEMWIAQAERKGAETK